MRMIYLDIDSLRPDHMSCYGYHRRTTPNLDRIAAEGMRFDSCYTVSSPCVPSRASFMSGRYGVNHGALTHWGPGCEFQYPEGDGHSERIPFFTRYLRKAGMKTVTFSTFGDRHHAWWYFAGWNEVHTHTLKEGNENADEVNAAVIPWLRSHGKEDNYFLHIQYWDPHCYYTYPKSYMEQWQDSSVAAFPDEAQIAAQQKNTFPRSASFLHWGDNYPDTMPGAIRSRTDFKHLIDGYDGAVSYMDSFVGELLETLRELGIEDEVCFVVSADHAESMGEQGIYVEHPCATEAVHHIPLIIKAPGIARTGGSYDGFLYNVDVIATITDMAGLQVPSGWDGKSYLQALKGEDMEGRDYLVMEHALYTCQRSVRDRRWFFLRTYHQGLYDFDEVILYDMERDPHQTRNVAGEHPEIVNLMEHRIAKWLQEQMNKPGYKADPMQKVIETGPYKYLTEDDWVNRLRSKGYEEAAAKLLGRRADEGMKPAYEF
ncbi:sulfatase-like hydrolase/transferase [Paenibacillus sp. KQZ6P-2]|uniref:Sulfatase-like hydrolase/transferase n=1 Tax=Paenibacillus mangrovi TaxID=2931978 RepID=A0A9X1WPN2_9BACL|nr:sulfatase [Paenibacillus mangrovi]MCJ8013102.1 sulfatase-like hydrolase/transferase [Paenibacillus mangrovi]